MVIKAKYVDLFQQRIFNSKVVISKGIITSVEEIDEECSDYICPGLIDSHVHIESSMLTPSGFSKLIVPRGTIAVVTDPHEIANVCGVEGVKYMIEDAKKTPLKVFFGVPSCVPATSFETNGAILSSSDVDSLLSLPEVYALSEVMNFPGVVYKDKEVMAKIDAAHKHKKVIDGHAPGLKGEQLKAYCEAGITTDHECVNTSEAIEKINYGVTIQIREGSAAKNFDALYPLFDNYADKIMLCTDDSHPDEIIQFGHIDKIIKKGILRGVDIFKLLRAATIKPVEHYNLPIGLLRVGDKADFIIVDNLENFKVKATFIDGVKVYDDGKLLFDAPKSKVINNFNCSFIDKSQIKVPYKSEHLIRTISAVEGDLLTSEFLWDAPDSNGFISPDVSKDILKIVVVNRYKDAEPIVGFIKNIGLKKGALASSVAHDSHNIIAVGTNDEDIVDAVNSIITAKGGISYVDKEVKKTLQLEVGGLMTTKNGVEVAEDYLEINSLAHKAGSPLHAPFMTMAFMSLLVIPQIKIGDKGLFDVSTFKFTNLYVKK